MFSGGEGKIVRVVGEIYQTIMLKDFGVSVGWVGLNYYSEFEENV